MDQIKISEYKHAQIRPKYISLIPIIFNSLFKWPRFGEIETKLSIYWPRSVSSKKS